MTRQFDWSFPRQVLMTFALIAGTAIYPLVRYATKETTAAALIGALLSTANVLFGYAAIEYSWKKSATTFFKVVLGGMGIRMLSMAALLALLIKAFAVEIAPLVWSVLVFYTVFLALEVVFIQKKFNQRQQE